MQSPALSLAINPSHAIMHKCTLFILMPCDTPAYVRNLMILPFPPWVSGYHALLQSQLSSPSPDAHSVTRRFCCRKNGKTGACSWETEERSLNCLHELTHSWGTSKNNAAKHSTDNYSPLQQWKTQPGQAIQTASKVWFSIRVTGHKLSAHPHPQPHHPWVKEECLPCKHHWRCWTTRVRMCKGLA